MKNLRMGVTVAALLVVSLLLGILLQGLCSPITDPEDPAQLGAPDAAVLDRLNLRDSTLVLTAAPDGTPTLYELQKNLFLPRWRVQEQFHPNPAEADPWQTAAQTPFTCYPYQITDGTHIRQEGLVQTSIQWPLFQVQYLSFAFVFTFVVCALLTWWEKTHHPAN